jgi:hypothetical protein
MKRNILDITKNLYRSNNRVRLNVYDLDDTDYYIYKTENYKLPEVLYEMSEIDTADLIRISINNVFISNDDFIVEKKNDSITIKFIKSRIVYGLDENDVIILNASVQ